MGAVTEIGLYERVHLNPDRLVELCVKMGETAAEALVGASFEDLGDGTDALVALSASRNHDVMVDQIQRLSHIAEHVGLTTYVKVAGDVEDAMKAGDHNATAATLARLQRVASKAQSALWDLRDMMI